MGATVHCQLACDAGSRYCVLEISLTLLVVVVVVIVVHKTKQFKEHLQAGEMAQWVRAPVAKSKALSSIPGPYMVERDNQVPQLDP